MEEHRRALDTTKLPPQIEEKRYGRDEVIGLLRKGEVEQFNGLCKKGIIPLFLDLTHADLSGAKLSRVYLTIADLSHAMLSDAKLLEANLSHVKA